MRSAKNIKLSCKSLKEKDDVILNRMLNADETEFHQSTVVCYLPSASSAK